MSSNVIKYTTTVFTNCTVAPVAFNIFLWLFPHDNLVHNRFITPNNVWSNPSRGKCQMSLCLHALLLGYGKDCLVHQGKLVMGIKIKENKFCKQNSYAIYNLTVTAKNTID